MTGSVKRLRLPDPLHPGLGTSPNPLLPWPPCLPTPPAGELLCRLGVVFAPDAVHAALRGFLLERGVPASSIPVLMAFACEASADSPAPDSDLLLELALPLAAPWSRARWLEDAPLPVLQGGCGLCFVSVACLRFKHGLA